ncbi:unnamed protein product [Leptosia nina]|uniref:Peptidase S1 domain-containing protein n=1 Tax=Leptosia nina TaxID=320188 RepID=A0AAV1JBC2_9NEOP
MVSHLTLAVLLFAGTALVGAKRIIGGEDTTIEEYPYIVQVETYRDWENLWRLGCGANILTTRWLMSAAHCFAGWNYRPDFRRIRAGTTIKNTGGSVHYVDYAINHPEYTVATRYDGDINVVRLLTPLVYTPVIQKATIVPQDYILPDNVPVVHAGWGHTTQGGSTSRILQHVEMYSINTELCRQRYLRLRETITDNMICAGLLDVGGRDACQGDSGGPLYAGGSENRVIVGVVAWGHGCANETYPGVSTRVASYTNWVRENAR